MIRVNLVRHGKGGALISPVNLAAAGAGGDLGADFQRQIISRGVLVIVGPILMYLYFGFYKVPDLQARRGDLENQLRALETINAGASKSRDNVATYKIEKRDLETKIAVLERLEKGRSSEIAVLKLIQVQIPERVWLTKLDFKDGTVSINGNANSDSDATNFEDMLSGSIFLSDVNMGRISEVKFDRGAVGKAFQISAKIPLEAKPGGPDGR